MKICCCGVQFCFELEFSLHSTHTQLQLKQTLRSDIGFSVRIEILKSILSLQVVSGRFKALLAHSQKLIQKRWIFGIADDFITKQLPHNVTWGLSLMYAMDHKGNRALTSVQGKRLF